MGLEHLGTEDLGPYRASRAPHPNFDTDFAPWVRFWASLGPKRAQGERAAKSGRAENQKIRRPSGPNWAAGPKDETSSLDEKSLEVRRPGGPFRAPGPSEMSPRREIDVEDGVESLQGPPRAEVVLG